MGTDIKLNSYTQHEFDLNIHATSLVAPYENRTVDVTQSGLQEIIVIFYDSEGKKWPPRLSDGLLY